MLRDLKQGELDLVLAVFAEEPKITARHVWTEEPVWVRSDATKLDPDGPVPLVSYGGGDARQRLPGAAPPPPGLFCHFAFPPPHPVTPTAPVAVGACPRVLARR